MRVGIAKYVGLTPFALYVLVFLAVPTVLAVGTGFFTEDGAFTFANIAGIFEPAVLGTFISSFWVSAVTAIIGALVGALVCYAMLGTRAEGALRTVVDSASSVFAQFGGVMLAFAFITAIGTQGVVTKFLVDAFGLNINENGPFLYTVPGLLPVYIYFQVPLMIITFMPALEGLKPQWAEANATLGGTRFTYWTRIAIPVLAPSFLGSLLLLFANAFSSYATAAALISQGSQIVPLQIRSALVSETVLGRENMAGALALGMIVVMIVVMTGYSALFDPDNARTYRQLFQAIGNSFLLAAVTVAIVLVVLLPTMVLVHIQFPRLRRVLEFICIVPITVPAIVLVVGLAPVYSVVVKVFGGSVWTLAFAYGVTVLPYAYRAIQANLDAIPVVTLSEAARTLGANWLTVLWRVLLPNLRRGVLAAAFISVAVVLGEFTIASLLNRRNLQTALLQIGQSDPWVAVILALLALAFAFVLLLLIGRLGSVGRAARSKE